MNSETIGMCVIALLLGMLLFNMLKNICGCKVIEGQNNKNKKCNDPRYQKPSLGETAERLMYTEACINCSNTVKESNIFIYDPDYKEKCRALSKSDVNTATCGENGVLVNKDNNWNASYGPGTIAPIIPCIGGDVRQCNTKPRRGIIDKACKVCGNKNSWYSTLNGGCSPDSKCPDSINNWIKYDPKECSSKSKDDCAKPGDYCFSGGIGLDCCSGDSCGSNGKCPWIPPAPGPGGCAPSGTTCLRGGAGAVDCCDKPGCPASGMCP